MKRAKKRQAKYADRGSKPVDFQVGDPVYYKRRQRRNKLEGKWQTYYRVVEKTSLVTSVIRNQLDGVAVKVHAEHLRLAKVENWKFQPMIQRNLIEGLLTWFLLRKAPRRVVAVNQRVGTLYPRLPGGIGGKGTILQRRRTHLWQS